MKMNEACRTQLRDEYRERIRRTVLKHANSRGIPAQGLTSYAANLDADKLRVLVQVLHGEFEQLIQDILKQQ